MQIVTVTAEAPAGRSSALLSDAPPIDHGSLPGTTVAPPVRVQPVEPASTPALTTGV